MDGLDNSALLLTYVYQPCNAMLGMEASSTSVAAKEEVQRPRALSVRPFSDCDNDILAEIDRFGYRSLFLEWCRAACK